MKNVNFKIFNVINVISIKFMYAKVGKNHSNSSKENKN